jgi:hypothetical protein
MVKMLEESGAKANQNKHLSNFQCHGNFTCIKKFNRMQCIKVVVLVTKIFEIHLSQIIKRYYFPPTFEVTFLTPKGPNVRTTDKPVLVSVT